MTFGMHRKKPGNGKPLLQRVQYVGFVMLLLSGSAFAQSEIATATLNGTVTDPSGSAVPNAKVTVTGSATGLTRTVQTNEAGLYSFGRLPVGTYDLTIEAAGFRITRRTGISLSVGAVATIDLQLEIGATQEAITVSAETPLIEATRSQNSTVVDARDVANLPVNGRNFLDFTGTTPGVVRDPTRTGDLSFGGQRGTANSLLVDGVDSNNVFFGQSTGRAGTGRNPYSFSQDAVQEFQVTPSGYSAETGRAAGGVINVVTKSGTNQIHGTIFEFYRDKALNANSWENNQRRIPKRAYHFNQFGGNLGGPIVKNRLFFFFDYDGQRNTTPNPVFLTVGPDATNPLSVQGYQSLQKYLTPYSNGLNNDVYLGKVDWNAANRQRLSVRYNANRFVGQNFENSGNASALEHTGNSNVTTDNLAAEHTFLLGPSSVLESRFAYTRDNEPGLANSTAPEAVIRQNGTTVLSIGRNSFSPRYTNAATYQWVESLSLIRGRHSLKFGEDMDFQRIENFFPGNFSGSFVFNSYADFASLKPFSFTQAFAGPNTGGPLSRPNVNEYAFYAQDSWRVTGRLTLNYGVRYDDFGYAQPRVKNPDPGLAARKLDTSRIHLDRNNLAPRFGFAYKADRSGSTVVRGGYGIYYGRTPSILTGTAITTNGIQVQSYTLLSNFPIYPNILSAPPPLSRTPDIFLFAPDYVQPLTHQWSVNIDRRLGRNYAVTIGYLGVRGEHLSRTRDINLLPVVPVQGSYADGTPVTFLRHPGRLNPNFGRISLVDSGADSIYHGGFVQLTKRFSQNFQALTSYTFSKVIDDAPDQTSVVVGTDDVKNAQDTLNPNLERGRGNADIRHRFVFSGIWDINYGNSLGNAAARALLGGYQLAMIASAQSGRPYNVVAGGDVNNDGNTRTDRPPYVGRNTITGPNFADVDLRVTRSIHLRQERLKLHLIFEGFNLTNRANFSSILNTQYNFNAAARVFTPVPTFRQPTTTFDPRILQLAAKITF
jgi:outer membrane receptor protein involved in Fe transport